MSPEWEAPYVFRKEGTWPPGCTQHTHTLQQRSCWALGEDLTAVPPSCFPREASGTRVPQASLGSSPPPLTHHRHSR